MSSGERLAAVCVSAVTLCELRRDTSRGSGATPRPSSELLLGGFRGHGTSGTNLGFELNVDSGSDRCLGRLRDRQDGRLLSNTAAPVVRALL
jgi:hypothetical protein